jgi:hypothetical protein
VASRPQDGTSPDESVLVACLCAGWCHVCDDYRGRFEQVRLKVQVTCPQARFLWLDIEDEADLLHPLDVDNFPTILLAVGGAARFFGPLTPQAQTLERLILAHLHDAQAPTLADPDVQAVVAKIRLLKPA